MKKKYIKIIIFTLLFLTAFTFTNMPLTANAESQCVYLGGFACGFSLKTVGAEVVGVSEVFTGKDSVSPAKLGGIQPGDRLMSLGEIKISSSSDVAKCLSAYKGGAIVAVIERNGEKLIKELTPVKNSSGVYKLGLFLRDNLNGIGTVTYIKDFGDYAALGHPVIDGCESILKVDGGLLYRCCIIDVVKGERGKAGELKGVFVKDNPIGKVKENTESGLRGSLNSTFDYKQLKLIETSTPKQGKATLFTTISENGIQEFECSIVKMDNLSSSSKNFVVKITDENLLKISGGIVQGMSGSPIVQNGKLVGAITHVFVNDPTRGFGITVDNMLEK